MKNPKSSDKDPIHSLEDFGDKIRKGHRGRPQSEVCHYNKDALEHNIQREERLSLAWPCSRGAQLHKHRADKALHANCRDSREMPHIHRPEPAHNNKRPILPAEVLARRGCRREHIQRAGGIEPAHRGSRGRARAKEGGPQPQRQQEGRPCGQS